MCRPRRLSSREYGISLIELAVVLAVIGLIAGSILVGQHLIRASQIRSIPTEINHHIQAFHSFRDKYKSLPGDMPNATDFWGIDPDGCPAPSDSVPERATCNGNGDGMIGDITWTDNSEIYRSWQHLSNAGFITGMYTGTTGAGSSMEEIPGQNVPELRVPEMGIGGPGWIGTIQDPAFPLWYPGEYGHLFWVAGKWPALALCNPLLTPAETAQLDLKMDDGKPGTGKFTVYKESALPGCATSDDADTAVYNMAVTVPACDLMIISGF